MRKIDEKIKLHFLASLSWADDSLLGLEVARGIKIEKWSIERFIAIMKDFTSFDENGCREVLRDQFCLDENEKSVYVISGSYNVKITDEKPLLPHIRKLEAEGYGGYIRKAKNGIRLMRLYKEGSLGIPDIYIYRKNRNVIDLEINYSNLRLHGPPEVQYSLTATEKEDIGRFLKRHSLPFSPPYIQLAFDNFDLSFNNQHLNLDFLCLMIAAEVLFNDGSYELKYRITRGMAILLGTNKTECHEIYSNMKKLYDKRSRLVHTGKASISLTDVILLRRYLRNSIKELLRLRLSKTELSKRLMETGFGQSLE